MNLLRRWVSWFKERSFYFKASIIGGVALAAIVVTLLVTGTLGKSETSAVAEDIKPVAFVTATTATAPPVEVAVEDIDKENPRSPRYAVETAPISDYLTMLEDTPSTLISDVVVNGATGVTAALFGTGDAAKIVASQYLPEQTETLLSAYDSAGLPVTVSTVNTAKAGTGAYAGRYPVAGATSAASSGSSNYGITVLWVLAGVVIFSSILFWFTNRNRNKALSGSSSGRFGMYTGNSSKKEAAPEMDIPTIRFTDVAGCDEAIDELQELAEFLKDPERYAVTGAKGAKGALLVGPPGTGKTLLARAVAGEAGVPFFTASGSDFVEMYVGVGAKRVRELFAKAKKHPASIIFIDEIDAVGRARGGGQERGNQEHENTLNALLVELDGFEKTNIVVIGATNRDDLLDKALTRPGRLDRKVQVPLPDRGGRAKILAVHAEGKPLAADVSLENVAKRTPGMSGADLAALVNEAAVFAARAGQKTITAADFDQAVATLAMGKARKSAIISDEDKKLTAWHEAGHAVCGLAQPDGVNPVAVSIVPRGQAGGVTWFPGHDSGYLTRRSAYAELVTAMGGMAAEQLLFGDGEFTTGPSGDLQAASQRALDMVTQRGMGEWLLVRSEGILGAANESTEDAVKEANALIHKALTDAKTLLEENRDLFDAMVEALLEYEDIGLQQIEELVQHRPVTAPTMPPPAPRQAKVPVAPVPVKKSRQRPKVSELVGAAFAVTFPSKRRKSPAA